MFFDTIGLIENATEIHVIDSCWMIFIYLLNHRIKLNNISAHCIRGYNFMVNEPLLTNWQII